MFTFFNINVTYFNFFTKFFFHSFLYIVDHIRDRVHGQWIGLREDVDPGLVLKMVMTISAGKFFFILFISLFIK